MAESPITLAVAPAKAILFGEHAVNRGQPAIAAAVGLYARCRAAVHPGGPFVFRSGSRTTTMSRQRVLDLAREIDRCRRDEDYDGVRNVARSNYFAPQQYVLASMFDCGLPPDWGLSLEWDSEVPSASGLGSGGSAFVAMVAAVSALLPQPPDLPRRVDLAHRGDVVAHGGVASSLDTQTSLHGGVVRFTAGGGLAQPLDYAPSLALVIGHTRAAAATGEVNAAVRRWLAERPRSRLAYFEAVGALSRAAEPLLAAGDWKELGELFNLNQLVLEKIGVSTPQADRLIDAALDAGAYGAKVSGSGGGGIVIALVSPEARAAVAEAINAAGGTAMTPEVGVRGAYAELCSSASSAFSPSPPGGGAE